MAGGRLAGRRLRSPASGARPATGIIRASIFDRPEVQARVDGGRILDLYAGAGYLGIEALSHGAAWVDFVERDGPACAVIRRNLDDLDLGGRARVHRMPVERCFARLREPADLIFVDPPYGVDGAPLMERLCTEPAVGSSALVLWRRPIRRGGQRGAAAPERFGPLVRIDQRRYGDGALETYLAEETPA